MIKTLFIPLAISAGLLAPLSAQAAPASSASIETLLSLSKSDTMVESMYGNIEQAMRTGLIQSLGGKPMNAKQEESVANVPRKFIETMRQEMGWPVVKPDFIAVYADTFTQEEIDGMIAFYKTPAGRAMIDKMPQVMQKTLAASQTRMQAVLPKIQATMEQAIAEMKAAQ